MHKSMAFYLLFFPCAVANSQEQQADESPVLAMIGREAITQAEVDFHLSRPAGSLRLSRAALENTLLLMAQQRQALQTLRKSWSKWLFSSLGLPRYSVSAANPSKTS